MEKLRISRKSNTNSQKGALIASYDKIIQEVFQEYSRDLEEDFEGKCAKIKEKYYEITDPDIERNELFLGRLTNLKFELIQNRNMDMIQDFVKVIYLLNEAEIISFEDFADFIDFQRELLMLNGKSIASRPTEEIPPKH